MTLQGMELNEAELASLSQRLGDGAITQQQLEELMREGSMQYLRRHQVTNALKKIGIFIVLGLPVFCCGLAALFGAILSAVEGWPYRECFYVVLMELSGTNIDLHTLCGETEAIEAACAQTTAGEAANAACATVAALEDAIACEAVGADHCVYTAAVAAVAEECDEHPEGPGGKIVAALIGVISIAIFGGVLAVMGGPLLAPFVTLAKLEPHDADEHPVRSAVVKLTLLIFCGLPLFAIVIAALFGGLLAALEGWAFQAAFYAVLAEITACEIELTDMAALAPENDAGRLVAAIVGLWSMATFAAVIGISSGSLVEPIIDAMKLTPKEPVRGEEPQKQEQEGGAIKTDQAGGGEVRQTEQILPQP